jgi:hypothetical protein
MKPRVREKLSGDFAEITTPECRSNCLDSAKGRVPVASSPMTWTLSPGPL